MIRVFFLIYINGCSGRSRGFLVPSQSSQPVLWLDLSNFLFALVTFQHQVISEKSEELSNILPALALPCWYRRIIFYSAVFSSVLSNLGKSFLFGLPFLLFVLYFKILSVAKMCQYAKAPCFQKCWCHLLKFVMERT